MTLKALSCKYYKFDFSIVKGLKNTIFGVTESGYESQFRIYPKVSLSLSLKNLIKEDSYLKSATPSWLLKF
jgi:hypothetical protein